MALWLPPFHWIPELPSILQLLLDTKLSGTPNLLFQASSMGIQALVCFVFTPSPNTVHVTQLLLQAVRFAFRIYFLVLPCAAFMCTEHQPHPPHRLHQSKPGAILHLLPAPSLNAPLWPFYFSVSAAMLQILIYFDKDKVHLRVLPVSRSSPVPEDPKSTIDSARSHPSTETVDLHPPLQTHLWH